MLRKISASVLGALIWIGNINAQTPTYDENVQTIRGTFLGKTPPVRDFVTEFDFSTVDPDQYFEIKNFKDRYRTSPVERNLYPKLDALWTPNQGVTSQRIPQSTLLQSFNGMGFTGVQPPDPCMAAGNDKIVQMINGSGGAKYKVWNKSGVSLSGALNFDNLFPGISGLGDPIILYDQIADRWFLSEFASSGNKLMVAVSVTSDPLGSYYTYTFQANSFPDYPKYSVWPDAYYCTSNENSSALYAFERDSMLVGASADMIRKSVQDLSGFGFQTLTPVYYEGTNISTSSATFWRHVDDEAHYPAQADPFSDWVEYWTFEPNFANPNASTFTGPSTISVTDFDSDLNGYYAFSAIKQPNTSTKLDPLREVFMNRMNYRNFGIFESIVGCHVTDVDGSDWAGMRWYEFRKTDSTNWVLYQEGTYAPDSDSRWMGSIDINSNGSICLAYSVSSTTTRPSLRYTGRNAWDSVGIMTLPEQSIVVGNGSNSSNRYGDYASMTVDPADDSTFWFTGEYNPSSSWSTRIAHIALEDTCNGLMATSNLANLICPGDSTATISIQTIGGPTGNYNYSVDGITYQANNIIGNIPLGNNLIYVKDNACIAQVNVTIPAPENFNISYNSQNINCFGDDDGKIVVSGTGGTAPLEYSLDNATWNSSNVFDSLTNGIYTVYIQDANGCQTQIDSIAIIEPPQLIVADSIVPSSSSTAADGSVYLNVTGGTPTYLYSIDSLSFKASNFFSGLSAGAYSFYIIDGNGCTVTLTDVNLYSVSVNEIFTDENLIIFPNPTTGKFQIKLGQILMRNSTQIKVHDITGKIIFNKVLDATNANYTQEIELSNNSKGFYFVTITTNNESKTIQIVLK